MTRIYVLLAVILASNVACAAYVLASRFEHSSAVVNGWLRGPRCVIELRDLGGVDRLGAPTKLGVSVHEDVGTQDVAR